MWLSITIPTSRIDGQFFSWAVYPWLTQSLLTLFMAFGSHRLSPGEFWNTGTAVFSAWLVSQFSPVTSAAYAPCLLTIAMFLQTHSPYWRSPIVLLIWLSFLAFIKFALFGLGPAGLRRLNTRFAALTGRPLSSSPGNFLGGCGCVICGWGDSKLDR